MVHPPLMGSSMLSRTDGPPAEETLPSPDCPCQGAMPRSLCLGKGLFPLCPPLANPLWEVGAALHPPGFCRLILDKGLAFPLFHPLIVLGFLCL